MPSTIDAVLTSWSMDPVVLIGVLVAVVCYLRGWLRLRGRGADQWGSLQLSAFVAGNLLLLIALESPLDSFAGLLLQVHMLQHLLLTVMVPPLIWYASPGLPLLVGCPVWLRREWIDPALQTRWVRRLVDRLVWPPVALAVYVAATWIWHAPVLYTLALERPAVHIVEHLTFLAAGLLFWYPLLNRGWERHATVAAGPSARWLLIPYLFLAGVQGTVLAGLLTFSERVLYSPYEAAPRLLGISALDDQAIAGALMWVVGSL